MHASPLSSAGFSNGGSTKITKGKINEIKQKKKKKNKKKKN